MSGSQMHLSKYSIIWIKSTLELVVNLMLMYYYDTEHNGAILIDDHSG